MSAIRWAAAVVSTTLLLSGVPASADRGGGPRNVPLKTEPVAATRPQAFNWSGIYAGGHMGGGWSSVDHDVVHANGMSEKFRFNMPSRVGGFHGGLQTQWGNLVIGLEASLTSGSYSSKRRSQRVDNLTEISDIDWQFMLTPRIGYAVDNLHVYIKGGLASAEIFRGVTNTNSSALLAGKDQREAGWTIGAGFEQALSRWVIIGVDYSYVRIDGSTASAWPRFVAAGFVPGRTLVRDVEQHAIMARLTFMLGNL